ncbi:hypothetical protein N2152v2_010894 [Parachlorella kessleri]
MNKSTELPAAPGPSPPSAAHPGSPPRPVPHNSTGAATELRARQARAAALAGFQWKLYSLYSGSLLSSASQRQVEQHYLQHNLTQQACYQRPPLASIRYNTIGGLANQLLSHLGALAMAEGLASRGLPVQVVLQPALSRTSFKSITPFVELPTSSLFDTKRMAHYWGPRGVTVLEQGASLDNCTKVHVDWLPSWPLPRNLAIKDSIERLGASIGAAVCKAVRNSTAHDLCVPLDFDGFLFTFNHSRSFPECEVAARGLFFCREVVTAAELVTEQLKTSACFGLRHSSPYRGWGGSMPRQEAWLRLPNSLAGHENFALPDYCLGTQAAAVVTGKMVLVGPMIVPVCLPL